MLDDLFTYRLAGDRFLTVTNASNHEQRPRVVRAARRAASTSSCTTASHDYAMLAVQGPEARGIVAGARRRRAARSASAPRRCTVAGAPDVLVCGTGYTGEDGVELLVAAASTPAPSGTRVVEAGAAPAGLGARDTLRLEVCFHLYGNDLMEDARPDRGRPRAGAARRTPASSAPRPSRAVREAGPPRSSSPFAITGPGIARQGNPVVGGGEVTSGTLSPCLRHRHRHGLRAAPSTPSPAPRSRSTSAARPAPPRCARSPCTRKET